MAGSYPATSNAPNLAPFDSGSRRRRAGNQLQKPACSGGSNSRWRRAGNQLQKPACSGGSDSRWRRAGNQLQKPACSGGSDSRWRRAGNQLQKPARSGGSGDLGSSESPALSYATVQGVGALVEKFRNYSVVLELHHCRPRLFHTRETAFRFSEKTGLSFFDEIGKKLPFPPANNDAKLQCLRHQTAFLFSEKTGLPFFGEIGKELPFPPAKNDTKLLCSVNVPALSNSS
ncbi:hypothetical protein BKA81DRAFT_401446 [Phyllosticta paracitricarpa]|uniref:Uncharacterized protein n=1 Tax=Phyllosticta paracitricarpa TaxID=2016321 RepID=A0ABR1MX82_9PEZI